MNCRMMFGVVSTALVFAIANRSVLALNYNPDPIKVEIVAVPPSYYADSESWVPFRFKVTGAGTPITVTGGTVEFYIGDSKKFDALLLAKPFKPANGTDNEYLAVVDQAKFDTVSTSGGIVENARFKLKSVTCANSSYSFGPCDSDYSSSFKFGDNTIEVIEFGLDENFDHRKASTRQDKVDRNETDSLRHMASDTVLGPFPHDDNEAGTGGFDSWFCGLMAGATATHYVQRSYLEDDWDFTGVFGGNTFEARSLDRQRGVYWVAFRNQVPATAAGNPFGVPVVGIVASCPGSVTLFEDGTAKADIAQGGLTGSGLSVAFGLAAGSLGAAAFVAGPATPALECASAIFWALQAIVDACNVSADNPDMAEVVAYKVIDMANGTTRPAKANATDIVRAWTVIAGNPVPLNIANPALAMNVDTTYRMYLSTSTNVRALSRYLESINVEAKLEVDLGNSKFDVAWPALAPEQKDKIACDK
jgi:hypothetical protein